FSRKEDIEISGFLTATISWGNRKSILKNANSMMERMDHAPYDFVMQHSREDLEGLQNIVHRTFNGTDLRYFVRALRNIYLNHDGLEGVFVKSALPAELQPAIHEFKKIFFERPHEQRTEKPISGPFKKTAAKR